MGDYLGQRLKELKAQFSLIKEIRGMGLMWGVELNIPAKGIVESCLEKRLLINCTHDTVLRLMPALNVTQKQIDQAVKIIAAALKEKEQ